MQIWIRIYLITLMQIRIRIQRVRIRMGSGSYRTFQFDADPDPQLSPHWQKSVWGSILGQGTVSESVRA
jgi:hypothetical protein